MCVDETFYRHRVSIAAELQAVTNWNPRRRFSTYSMPKSLKSEPDFRSNVEFEVAHDLRTISDIFHIGAAGFVSLNSLNYQAYF